MPELNAEAVVILSAPATYLAKALDLLGAKDLFKERVQRLIVVDSGAPQDVSALQRIMNEWPSPIFLCGRDVGEAVSFPAASSDALPASHPLADAYRAWRPMPYDSGTLDMAAAMYAVHPDMGFFDTVDVDARVKSLRINAAKQDELKKLYIELASAKPIVPQPRRNRPA